MVQRVLDRMSQKCLIMLAVWFLLHLSLQLSSEAPAPSRSSVFLSGPTADSVLRRIKRYNSGFFEEVLEGNLERECFEEKCDLEEARETFENDKKTMEFWAIYADENQCQSSPCLNQGSCEDHIGYYTCSCASGFTGMNCENVVAKRCDVNNGDCTHFCDSMGTSGPKCSCATGYKLMRDGASCEPEVEFPCGRTAVTETIPFRRFFQIPENETLEHNSNLTNPNSTATPLTSPKEKIPTGNDSVVKSFRKRLLLWERNTSEIHSKEPPKTIKRIVGGREVLPGEIPWQVALVASPSGFLFCGGSILKEHWVITAAHCLVLERHSFLVRVGEHNIFLKEGTEQDYEVLKQHIHPRYNASLSLYDHDIALLELKRPITFSTKVRPICIGPKAFTETLVKMSSPATVSGWGRLRFLGSTANTLQKVKVPFANRADCKQSSSARITSVMFCAGYYSEEKDACEGDSGGPHANRFYDTWFLTGIVSWGEECAKIGKYGVYTRLSLYYRWINHVMGVTKNRLVYDVEDPDFEELT